jgi:hypothetical protein
MTDIIHPIETHYRGYRFRSRLEARWSVFFDAAGIEWQYEVEGFDVNGTYYLPDFWLPGLKTFVEIKPDEDSAHAAVPVLHDLVTNQNCHGIIIVGPPSRNGPRPTMIDVTADYDWWRECDFCHHVCLGNIRAGSACRCPVGVKVLSNKRVCFSDPHVNHAFDEAQRARFEHGEDGTPTPFVVPTIIKPTTVYLAGAISRSVGGNELILEWRREIFPTPKGDNSWLDMRPGERCGPIIYGGPQIDSDHHGQSLGAHGCIEGNKATISELAKHCLEQLRKCEVLFVWIDRIETIGTMIEIGAAWGRMPIFVTFADRVLAERAYFAVQLADVAVVAPSAADAWKLFLRWWAGKATGLPEYS